MPWFSIGSHIVNQRSLTREFPPSPTPRLRLRLPPPGAGDNNDILRRRTRPRLVPVDNSLRSSSNMLRRTVSSRYSCGELRRCLSRVMTAVCRRAGIWFCFLTLLKHPTAPATSSAHER